MKPFSEHLHDVVSETRPISEDSPESMDMCEEAAKRYAREAIAEHLEREAESAVSWIQTPSDRGLAHLEIVSTEIILKWATNNLRKGMLPRVQP